MDKRKIIIVENEFAVRMELQTILEDEGYDVIATTGEAKDAIEKTEQLRPDLIFMDIKLDGKMDGFEAADIIKQQFGIPIIILTAYADEYKLEQLKITMPFGLILKPVQRKDLRVTVEMALYFAQKDTDRKRIEKELEDRIVELSETNEKLQLQQTELKQQLENLKKGTFN